MTRAKTFAEMTETDVTWIWERYIPEALLTVLIAPPKASKTSVLVDVAARKSRGDVMPDGTDGGPAAPILLGAVEDDSESSMMKKLRVADADMSMVVDVSGGPDGDGLELSLPHVKWLREVVSDYPGTGLIIIDTLTSTATKPITTGTGLKAMFRPLVSLAKYTGAGLVVSSHTRKDGEFAGGQSMISIPRQVLQITRSKHDPDERTLSVMASNITSDQGEGIRYRQLVDGDTTRIEWAWDAALDGYDPEVTGQARILLLLRNTPEALSAQMIAAKTGIAYPVVRVLLTRMKSRREVQSPYRGVWTVAA